MAEGIRNRYEFVYLFDVENGNPNGDPDAGNMPRIDPETNHGIVTDVSIKRKVRNYVELLKENVSPYEIYVRERAVLIESHERAYEAIGAGAKKAGAKRRGTQEEVASARDWMCSNFFDVRTFGAVMGLEVNCGQVRGPVQINFGRSIEPIFPMEVSITRMAVATRAEAESQQGDNRTMGRKQIVPSGLYRTEGFISSKLSQQTGFSEEDLQLLWEALLNMYDHDRSASRGKMAARKLLVFRHDSELGNAPAHKLFESVKVERSSRSDGAARSFGDYVVTVDSESIPAGVTLEEKL
jgi:CRISPR-associated protein Csd2